MAAEAGDNTNIKRAKRSAKKVANMTKPGSILLFHVNLVPKGTANLLKFVVEELRGQGYSFVKVSDLLKIGEEIEELSIGPSTFLLCGKKEHEILELADKGTKVSWCMVLCAINIVSAIHKQWV